MLDVIFSSGESPRQFRTSVLHWLFWLCLFCECGEEGRDFSSSDISKIQVRSRRRLKRREGKGG